ncbi:hypothetical protein BIFGAL_04177 [Bifidobacterium gallicum DSM 20093 = LMG 11596]|uniref:Uncharacterized protein n=1 Tax=Bifidobacterium gallicum DSM 20093 = LMG 11596 TaxID=561180 RepID=D1NWC9_9BIFI|nr:hypothetical protein BIFGAL_04177 [Bifidobacterium gallicum DSM 20093 = LMG 11596]
MHHVAQLQKESLLFPPYFHSVPLESSPRLKAGEDSTSRSALRLRYSPLVC